MNSAIEIFEQILSIGTLEDSSKYRKPVFAPGYRSLKKLCSVLAKNPTEQDLHLFLMKEPAFLFSMFGTNGDGDLAIISKPKIGNQFIADFALLKFSQGGCAIDLVEIERSSLMPFNKNGRPSGHLTHAIGQIDEWKDYIDKNQNAFVREIVRRATDLPKFSPEKSSSVGFRLRTPKEINQLWEAFGGFEQAYFRYSVLIGRWSELSEKHKKKLLAYNSKYHDLHQLMTYDQLARQALSRPNLDEW
jgi:hypothetical protein